MTLHKSSVLAKKVLPTAIWSPLRALATAIVTPIWFSTKNGHWKSSLRVSACDASGSPIPWYTYPAIDFLAQRDFKDRNILEFGGGQSTLWWSARARSVLTIEENIDWFSALRSRIGRNVSLHHVPVDRETRNIGAVQAILESNPIRKFDIIVVDGHLRAQLTTLAFEYLASGGAIVVDNAEGYGIYNVLKIKGCRRIDFFGFAPGVSLRHCTSIAFVEDSFLLSPNIKIPNIELTS